MQLAIENQNDFLAFIRDEAMPNGNLSIRGVSRCCGVDDKAILNGADFKSQKLGQTLTTHGFWPADLSANGFPPQAVWLTIEYFAYESKAAAPMAKRLARLFGSIGVMAAMNHLREVAAPHTPNESSFAAANETLAFMQSLSNVVLRYGGNQQAASIHALTMTAAKHPEVAPVIDQTINHMLCCRHVEPAPLLTPTDIAHIMGAPMSAQKVNHMLLNLRLQTYSSYDANENWSTYELTDIGRNYGRVVYPMVKGANRCVPQIKWLQTTLELLAV
jgi:hypothetical protein